MRKLTKALLQREILALVVIFVITCATGLTPWVYSDGAGDYAWVRSVVIQGSLDCRDEFEHFVAQFMKLYGWTGPTEDLYPATTQTGYQANKYPIGTAVLWSPFFVAAHAYAHLARALGHDIPTDGYSYPYVFAISFASCLYGFLGILLTYLALTSFYSRRAALLTTLLLWFATSVPVYMYLDPSMPHATSLFATSLLIYWWLRLARKPTAPGIGEYAVLGLLGGFATLVRVENAMFLLAATADLGLDALRQQAGPDGAAKKWKRLLPLLVTAACSFVAFLPQLIVWKIVFGKVLFNPYSETTLLVIKSKGLLPPPGEASASHSPINLRPIFQYLSHPYLFDAFFSSSHGLFVWTPVYVPAFVGLLFFVRRQGKTGAFMLLGLLAFVYFVSCSDLSTGASFGNRYLIAPLMVFAFGLGYVVEWVLAKVRFRYVVAVAVLLVIWNALLIVQYSTGLINRAGPVPLKKMFTNQFYAAPEKLVRVGLRFLAKRSRTYQEHRQRSRSQRERQNVSPSAYERKGHDTASAGDRARSSRAPISVATAGPRANSAR